MAKAQYIKLYLEVKEVSFKEGKKEKKFNAFKTKIGGLNMDVKFTKEADENYEISKSGYVEFDVTKINLDTRGDYPCLWIRE
jgi:hypothetical protein